MSQTTDLDEIRKQTRVALPSDNAYLFRLGVALYAFNSVNSSLVETICCIDSNQKQTELLDLESGKILQRFFEIIRNVKKKSLFSSAHGLMDEVAELFEKANANRSDFVHSYPITNQEEKQILHRRRDSQGKYFEVDNCFLDAFIESLNHIEDFLYKIREEVKSKNE
ncbi:MAG: hypothetical protein ACOX0X_03185 [Candidatus Dojkabacteria bacterium]